MIEKITRNKLFLFVHVPVNPLTVATFGRLAKKINALLFFIFILFSGLLCPNIGLAQSCISPGNGVGGTCPPITNSDTCNHYNHLTGTPGNIQNPCEFTVPHICLTDADFVNGVYTSPDLIRSGYCCGASSSDRCINFVFCVTSSICAVDFDIVDGAIPPGALFYKVDCGAPIFFTHLLPTYGCVPGTGLHTLTFCKPGNNVNKYRIRLISCPTQIPDDSVRIGCSDTLIFQGVRNLGTTWNSIAPGASGQYNSYLNFTSAHDTVVITPTAPLPVPPYVDYAVSGFASASRCLTDSFYCDTVRVYLFPALTTALSDTAKYCAGQGGVNICAGASGGLPPYTYQWYSPPNTPISGATSSCYFATVPGLYSVQVNDLLSAPPRCGPKIDSVRVLLDAINIIQSHTNDSCFGQSNGTITIVTTGGTPPYTYDWSNIPGTNNPQNQTGLSANTYTVTVTDNGGGCVGTFPITITQPTPVVCNIDSTKNVGCNGELTGAIYTHCSGGTLPYTHQWSSGQVTEDITNIAAGTYTVTCTDLNGCTCTTSVVISQPGIIVPLITSVLIDTLHNVSCWGATDDTSCVSVTGGTPPYTYSWTPSGASTLCVTAQGGGVIICVTVTDANGCVGNACHNITQPDSLYLEADTISTYLCGNISCHGLNDGYIDILTIGGTGPYTYDWSDIPGVAPPGPDEGEDRSVIGAGTYTVTVTDANGCTSSLSVTLIEPPALTDTLISPVFGGGYNIPCLGQSTGIIDLVPSGGCLPYTFDWADLPGANDPEDRSNLPAGIYCVTITDANGCTVYECDTLTEPAVVVALITILSISPGNPISCFGICDGSALATVSGGSPPYSYNWSQVPPAYTNLPGDTVSGLCAGNLILIVSDTNGCFATDTASITEPTLLTVSATASLYPGFWNEPCNGDCLGSATATPVGGTPPYSYSWSNGCSTQTCNNLCAITYTVTVTDLNGCTATSSVTLIEPPALTLSLTPSVFPCGANVSCVGTCDGDISTSVGGGTAPYTYTWSSLPCAGPACNNLCSGTYTVTVTDLNGCTISASITLTAPPPVVIDSIWADTCVGGWNICCFYDTTGVMYVSASGGCAPYTYYWSNGATNDTVTNVVALLYYVTVTDANGCTAVDSITLTEPPQLTAILSAVLYDTTNISCNGACDGSVSAFPTGGTAPYSYVWSNGCNTQTCSGLCAGTYCVTITDVNLCDTVYCITLTEPTPLTLSIASTSISCDTACNNTATASASGGIGPYTYNWSNVPGPNNPPAQSGLCIGTYTVTVTDINGCTAVDSVIFNSASTALSVTITSSNFNGWNEPCNGNCLDTLTASASGGAAPYSYCWSAPLPCIGSAVQYNVCAGTYTVTATDANGCSGTASFTVTEPPLLTVNSSAVPGPCFGDCLGQVSAAPSGGTPPYSYSWSNGCNTQLCDTLCIGTYTVTVTDANGCTATSSVTLTQPPQLVIDSISLSNFNGWNVHCNGDCDGYATVYPSGGTPPYQYDWSSGPLDTLQTDSNLCAGIYCVTVTDANGCTATACDTLLEPPVLSVSGVVVNDSCFNSCRGAINITAAGGTPGYSYDWSDIPGSPDIEDRTLLCDGTYTVTVTDLNGCTVSASFTVTEPPLLTAILSGLNFNGWGEPCNGDCFDTLTATAGGGTPPYSYAWSTTCPNNPVCQNVCAGTYTVTITDSLGCTATASFIVTEPPILTVSDTVSFLNFPYNTSCPNSCDAFATVYPSGGTAPYTIQWGVPLSDTTFYVDSLCGSFLGTIYFYTVTDANGCTVTDSIVVVDPYQPISVISTPDTNICANSITLIANVPLPIYQGYWVSLSGCGVFIPDSASPVIQVNNLCWGANCFVWVVGDTACIARDTVCIQATQPVIADAGAQYGNICEDDEPVHLHADSTYTGVGTWSVIPSTSTLIFDNPNDPNTFARNLGWGTNTIVWTVVDGPCRDADTIKITKLLPEICDSILLEMPTGFSPNGDAVNDHFIIHGVEYSFNRQNKLVIFNRWGNEVYSKNDYLNEWYGQNNDGGLLPDGTYFAIFVVTNPGRNQGKVLKGYVDLRR